MAAERPFKPVLVPLFRRPFWDKDPQVATFVRKLFGKMPIGQMPARVAEAFPGRAPSKSAIFRYMEHLRGNPPEVRRRPRAIAKSRVKPSATAK